MVANTFTANELVLPTANELVDLYCKRVGIGIGSPTSENFTTPQNYFDFSVTANSQVYII
jgi:hypothetical protein